MSFDFVNHSKDRYFLLVQWWNFAQFLSMTSHVFINSGRMFCPDYALDMHCTRGNFESRHYGSRVEKLEKLDAPEIHARRHNAKEVIKPKDGEKIIFQVADGK